jgi:phage terminase large subunit-like protein
VARSLTGGRGLLPWQRHVAAVAGEVDPDTDRMAFPVVVLVVPRRAGKTLLTFAKSLQRIAAPGVLSWYTAHAREVAAKIFRDEWAPLVDTSPYWANRLRVRRSQGSEGLTNRASGSKLQLFAPTANALHSTNADDVTIDEAWAFDLELGADVEAGIRPAQLTRPRRQTWIVSAGGTVESTWLDAWMTAGRDAAEADRRHDVAYFEWCADPADDPDDEATWWSAHPALGLTVPLEALREDHASMDAAAFARSILNVWPRPSVQPVSGVDPVAWQACADPAAAAARPYVFAFDVAPDAAAAAVAVAGAGPDGRCVLEVVAHGPGTAWLVPESLAGIRANYRGARIVADDLTAAAVVADATRRRLRIDTVPAGFVTRACGAFVDAVVAGMIAHRDQPALNAALRVARRRPVGDGWVWSLRTSAGDVTPLRAVTLAAWAWRSAPRRDGRVVALEV